MKTSQSFGVAFTIKKEKAKDGVTGYTADIDHLIPAECDHRFRVKLTTPFRGKLTRHSGPN